MGSARKTRVAVVFGGRSAEHAVSCASAGLVLRAIDRSRYDVLPAPRGKPNDATKQVIGYWYRLQVIRTPGMLLSLK